MRILCIVLYIVSVYAVCVLGLGFRVVSIVCAMCILCIACVVCVMYVA